MSAEVGRCHDAVAASPPHGNDLPQLERGGSRVHAIGQATLEGGVAVEQDRAAGRSELECQIPELVGLAAAPETEPVDQLPLVVTQKVQREGAAARDQAVAVVELVAEEGDARVARRERGANGAVGDHAVPLVRPRPR